MTAITGHHEREERAAHDDPEYGEKPPTPVSAWFSSNIKNLLIPAPLLLVALRVVRVGHGSVEAEQELIGAGTVLSVVFGALAPVVPYLLFATTVAMAIAGFMKSCDKREASEGVNEARRKQAMVFFTLLLVGLTLVVSSVPWPMLPYLAVWLLLLWLGFSVAFCGIVRRRWPTPSQLRKIGASGTIWICAALTFSLLQIGLDDRPWLPSEHIVYSSISNKKSNIVDVVGYVLKSESGTLTVLQASDRKIILLSQTSITSRQVCNLDRHNWWADVQASLSRKPTLLQLVTNEMGPASAEPCQLAIGPGNPPTGR